MAVFSSVTVVAHYNKFWVKLPGPIIYQHGVTPHPPQSDTTPAPVPTTTPSTLPGPVSVAASGLPIVTLVPKLSTQESINFNVKRV